jgi:hypothetical protein
MVRDCDYGNVESPQNTSEGHPMEILEIIYVWA